MKEVLILLLLFIGINTYSQVEEVFYFDNDKFELNKNESLRLENWLKQNKTSKVLGIHGYADENGADDYNKELSKKRSNFIYNIIDGKVPIRSDFEIINFGEDKLVSTNHHENRKVVIYFLDNFETQFEEYIVNNLFTKKAIDTIKIKEGFNSDIVNNEVFKNKIIISSVGSLFQLDNINFQFDSAELDKYSEQKLDKWLSVLLELPKLNIVVQGHICCVVRDDFYLSTKRAKSIKEYFVKNGVEENRIKYIGYGSDKPIYPIPEKNGFEALKNRRVEILILEN